MRYLLDLPELRLECRDAEQAALLASLYLTTSQRAPDQLPALVERLPRLAARKASA
jgi:hypothetical protein